MGIKVVHRGTSMATGSCPRDRLKILVGTVVGPTTTMEEAIWEGGHVKHSHRSSMGRDTSSGLGLDRLEPVSPRAARHQYLSRGCRAAFPRPAAGAA